MSYHKMSWNDFVKYYIRIFNTLFSYFIFCGLYSRTMQFAHQVLCSYEYSVLEKLPQQGLCRSVLQCAIC